jgi:hypothetical protein
MLRLEHVLLGDELVADDVERRIPLLLLALQLRRLGREAGEGRHRFVSNLFEGNMKRTTLR